MENREERAAVAARMLSLWKRMVSARTRGDWAEYHAYRHTWLAAGRLLAVLQEEARSEEPEQLGLLPPDAGRAHDTLS